MRVLYCASLASVHDLKWIGGLSREYVNAILVPDGADDLAAAGQDGLEKAKRLNITVLQPVKFDLKSIRSTLSCCVKLNRWIRGHEIDLIHFMFADAKILFYLTLLPPQPPAVLTCRGTDVLKILPSIMHSRQIRHRLVGLAYKTALRRMSAITCTSRAQLKSVKRLLGGREPELFIVRTGVDPDWCELPSKLPKPLEGKRFVVFPRNMESLYNHELALEAISLLAEDLRRNFCYVFLDRKEGGYAAKISALMNKVEAAIVWLPRLSADEMRGLFRRAELVVITALSDGSPVSAMEAMLAGCPVVLPPLPYDDDLFGQGVYRLKTWSPQELASVISAHLKGRLSLFDREAAKKAVLCYGNRQLEMAKLHDIYCKILERRW